MSVNNDKARDKVIEKLVAGGLSAQGAVRGPGCLDAAALAAYAERGLVPGERRYAEEHLASCLYCQKQVAALVRLSEGEEPLVSVKAAAPARKVFVFRWAWAAPTVLAVVVAGIVLTPEFRKRLAEKNETVATTPTAPPVVTLPPRAAVPASAPPTGAATPARMVVSPPKTPGAAAAKEEGRIDQLQSVRKKAEAAAGFNAVAVPSVGTGVQGGVGSAGARRAEGGLQSASGAAVGANAAPSERARLATQARPPSPALEKETATGAPEAKTASVNPVPAAQEKRAEAVAVTANAPREVQPENAPQAPVAAATQTLDMKTATLEKGISKNPPPLANAKRASSQPLGLRESRFVSEVPTWRVGAQGLIEKRDAQGNWTTRPSGVTADLSAIAFADDSYGWAVGQAGTVLKTSDGGATWIKVAFPENVDLIRVQVVPIETVTVMSRQKKVWSSLDGGETWTAVRAR